MVATIEVQINKFLSKDEREFKQVILAASTANIGDIEEAICQTNRKLGKALSKDARSQRIKTLENILQWLELLTNFEPFSEEYEGHKASFEGTDRGVTIDITTPVGETFQEKTESPAKSSLIRHFKLWVNKRLPKLELLEGVAQEKTPPSDPKVEIAEPVLSEKDLRVRALTDLNEGCSVQCRKSDRVGIYKGIQDTPMPYAWVTFENKTYPEPTNPLDLIKVEDEDDISRILAGKQSDIPSPLIQSIEGKNSWIALFTGHCLNSQSYKATWYALSGLHISFGWTTEYLGNKTVTRRDWEDSHAEKFIRAYRDRKIIKAYDKDPRYGGVIIGSVLLTAEPFRQPLAEMPFADLIAEGGMCETVEQFVTKYFDGNFDQSPWVINFNFEGNKLWHSRIADSSPESEALKKELDLQEGELRQSCSSKMIETRSQSYEATTQTSQSTPISEIGVPTQESLTSTRLAFPVPEHPKLEVEPDLNMQNQDSGSKHLGASASENQNSSLWSNLKDLSLTDFEQCLEASEWHSTRAGISNSYRERKLAVPKSETGYLLLPTMTSLSSKKSRAAGQTRLEKFFRDNGMLEDSQCLSGEMMESIMGFPTNHTKCLSEYQGEKQGGLEGDSSLVGQLFPSALQSPLNGSNISPDCFKIPNDLEGNNLTKDEVYGLIKQVNGVVETAPEFLKYSKNFIRYALVKIDNRRGYEDFDYKNMTEFLAERCNLFSKGYSTLQKEWQAGKLEYSLGFEIGTLPETQAREMYPLKDKIDECKQAYAMACSWAESENRKVRTGDIRLAVRNLLNISTIEPIKTKCGWVAGPNAARHYRVRILDAEVSLHDTYTSTVQELEIMVKAEQTPPEQLLIEGLLGAFAQSLGTSHAGAIAAAVEFLKSKNIQSAVA